LTNSASLRERRKTFAVTGRRSRSDFNILPDTLPARQRDPRYRTKERMSKVSEAKARRLDSLSTSGGVIAAIAIDQRKSLRQMIADAAGVRLEAITDKQLSDFKSAVTRVLTPHASAVLIDPEFGSGAFSHRAAGCGLLMTYESDGYENPRPHRMLALMPTLSVRRLRDMGADGIKILLSYTPFDTEESNDEKKALIERIGYECAALDMPFFLEPVGYDPGGSDPKSIEYAKRKPEIVLRSMEEFSKDIYQVDVLKVEFPVNAEFVEGSAVYAGQAVYDRSEALDLFRQADAITKRPYIYLSAGVSAAHFIDSLRMAHEAGAHFSGVLCGRATWQDGVPVFAREGLAAFEKWLQSAGTQNIAAVNDCLGSAASWRDRAGKA
jgi:tagatose 1,6-diphosphate aldolase